MFQSNPALDPKLFIRKIFCITTSSNVWVSHQVSRYTRSVMACMWHGQGVVCRPIEPISGSPRRIETKFFSIRASSNVWVSQQASRFVISDIACAWHRQGVVGAPIEPPPDPKLFIRKIFCITTSSHVWVSHQASGYTRSDMTHMWH